MMKLEILLDRWKLIKKNRQDEAKLLETTSAIASQLNLDNLLKTDNGCFL